MNTAVMRAWIPKVAIEEVQSVWPYRKHHTPVETQGIHNFLNAHLEKRLIKDVCHPHITVPYLEAHPDNFNTLFLDRHPADIAMAAWNHPMVWSMARLCNNVPDTHTQGDIGTQPRDWRIKHIVRGILIMQEMYKPVAKHTIHHDDLVTNHDHLFNLLDTLGYAPKRKDYLTDSFIAMRESRKERRNTDLWHKFNTIVQEYTCSTSSTPA
jgi:hypothetical protein